MKRLLCIAGVVCITYTSVNAQSQWRMQPTTIQTRWAKQVNPKNVLPEYPRPQMVRSKWTNLNGLWDYAITPKEAQQPAKFNGQILVPFPLESALSGVKKALQPQEILWYKRTVTKPATKAGERVLLHFGAVDFDATVYLNGKEIGNHKGGYQNFSFDVTDALTQPNNELVVKVWDPSDKGPNPHGKQVLNPGGIMYTPSSGIWQTVWLETVPEIFVSALKITPDVDESQVRIQVNVGKPGGAFSDDFNDDFDKGPDVADYTIDAVAKINGAVAGTGSSAAGEALTLKLNNAKLWSPDAPNLYDLVITVKRNGKTVDEVKSYFGMRKIEIKKDAAGVERIFLNNKYTYNLGTLDQGFWPDGLYTAPTDAALKYDIEASKAMGFNTIRKHIKIEPARWYYHCDKLGMLVWQDMVNPGNDKPDGREQFEKENKENIAQLYNYPSIVCWVLFNENWGAYDQARLTKWVKDTDPTRIVNGHSGSLIVNYNSGENTAEGLAAKSANSDLTDIHSYPPPGMPARIPGKAQVLGEFGGIGVSIPSHLWDDVASGWGYGGTVSAGTMRKNYAVMTDSLIAFEKRGLSGSIYTQPFDVEAEQNGLITYDREVLKIPAEEIRGIHAKLWPVTANYAATTKNFTAKIADTGKKDFATALKEYKAGKKDSASLRALAFLAAAEKDTASKGGRTFANEYVKLVKNPFAEVNLKFINRFTRSTTDAGFPIFYNNIDKINGVLGKDAAEGKITAAIDYDFVAPDVKKGKPDWNAIRQKVSKYGELGEELVQQTQVLYATNSNNWDLFTEVAGDWFEKYGSKRAWISDELLNGVAWGAFEKVTDKKGLQAALAMSEKSISTDPAPHRIDTYANLLYKLGEKEKAIEWEQKAVDLNPNEQAFKDALSNMQSGKPTWPAASN